VLIGRVLEEVKESESWSRTYLIRPAVNPAHVTSVMIMTPKRGSQGVGNIWADAAPSETALRTIVTAGDSLAREAALAENAARRRALDSLRRAGIGDSLRVDSTAVGGPDSAAARLRGPGRPRAVVPRRPDSVTPTDTARRDTVRRDTVRRDTIQRDTLRRDTLQLDPRGPRLP
jgi:hypothetical protein